MKDTYYFTHDYNARNDIKIKKLILKHGMKGYGLYWAIIEELYQNANALPTDYETIAFDMRSNSEEVESIINDFNLFEIKDAYFCSNSVERRLNERSEKSEKARESANKRWNKNANALQTHCDSNAIKERKGKEIKGNNIDDNSVWIEKFKNDFSNTETIAMNIGINKAYLDRCKKDFITMVMYAETKPSYREFLNHFTNWAKKNVVNYKNPPR
jgi:hypothetical protein